MNCLAAMIVSHFKKDMGGFYITAEDDTEEFDYIRYKDGRVSLTVKHNGDEQELPLYNENSKFVN